MTTPDLNTGFIVFFGFLIIMSVLGLMTYLRINKEYRTNKTAPFITRNAEFLSKEKEVLGHKNPDKAPELNRSAQIYYTAFFRLENGSVSKYDLPKEDWDMLAEGQRGELTTQGDWYKGFHVMMDPRDSQTIAHE